MLAGGVAGHKRGAACTPREGAGNRRPSRGKLPSFGCRDDWRTMDELSVLLLHESKVE